ncbi:hypothetical protein GCM10028803_58040 [Larkinella knui]|uniref:Uncharacterized protein n=1 Tax=Larkinella knui TaxID=2025310 RepID=A0A3P1CHL3_9BACT|nr:hypothetical protein [Larkinella knui]RRB12759.1 hypothetical protein EHT87_21520 [Larkinella knui]
MRRTVFIFALLVASCSPRIRQEQMRMAPSQLLSRSSDVFRTEPGRPIKAVRSIFLNAKNLNVHYLDGQSEIVPRNEVWGYSDKKGRIYRLYKRAQYEVVNVGDVITYEQQSTQNTLVGSQTTVTNVIETFYSKTLDSKIFSSRKKALQDLAGL